MTVLEPIAAHRLWAPTYDAGTNPLLALEERALTRVLPPVAGACAADVACGTGRWARFLAAAGARVLSIDLCHEMLRRAPKPAILADARRLPLPDASVDLAICAFALSYVGTSLSELARITRPGGTVLVSDMHPAAVERGWTRSFRTSEGEVVAIEHRPYQFESLSEPRLILSALEEAYFGESERNIFERAGRPGLFDSVKGIPAVFAARWIRYAD